MNTRLLRRIAKVIQEKPKQFDMNRWHTVDGRNADTDEIKSCGTAHCVAGWAQLLSTKADVDGDPETEAQRVLGLTTEQAERLFYMPNWPIRFQTFSENDSFFETNKWKPSAKKTAARIEHFIKTGGAA